MIYSNADIRFKVLVQAHSSETEDLLITRIEELLNRTKYMSDTSKISLCSINVTHLDPGDCPPHTTFLRRHYHWPRTNATMTAQLACNDKKTQFATRYCNISMINDKSKWESPNMEKCRFIYLPDKIMDLEKVNVTSEDAEDIAKHILNLTTSAKTLREEEIAVIISKTFDIVNIGVMNMNLAHITLEILNAVLTKLQQLQKFTNQILKLVEEVGQRVDFSGEKVNLTSKTLALALTDVTDGEFEEMFFCVTLYSKEINPEIFDKKSLCNHQTVATVFLPGTLRSHVSKNSRIQFNFFGHTLLFQNESSNERTLDTYVAGANIGMQKFRISRIQ
ncbi:adhesion G-protein coupled receptor G4-like [Rhinatrema bivittatum]|uniref:adhesion G-protein coupled receptor G4-like n=1 Tax=Rhinatrema bivittatum TaxID=194408 RepID=UPI0011264FA1|nr:adhesion G-protein coupled receptor G4-like [Rhinatrema bivittatum]